MDKMYRYTYADHAADAFAYARAAQTTQRDPRELNVLSEEEFNRLAKEAADKAARDAFDAMTPAQKMNQRLEAVAERYGPLKPWAT